MPKFAYGTTKALEAIIDFTHDLRTHPALRKVDFDLLNSLCEYVWENEEEEPDNTPVEDSWTPCDVWDTLRDLGFTQSDFI